ncbi:MAG: hypothetical protein H6811_11905 [Phycisphaeraceae bacterium]|nr:hypothetical protein [Phycisphaeraceae bacterium]
MGAASLFALPSRAQSQPDDEPEVPAIEVPRSPDELVEAYLERLGLETLRETQLRDRLGRATPDEREAIAERLGAVYSRAFALARTAEDRARIELLARDLLARVPEADSYDLRLSLAKARYLTAETIAERARVRLASEADREEATQAFRDLHNTLQDLGSKIHRRVEQFERIERSGRRDGDAELQANLAEARRLRSIAMYYSGWTNYYLALLSGAEAPAVDALKDFGWLLQSSGERIPTLDRTPRSMFRYEHIARAALGVALCHALRGNDVDAIRWLDAVREGEEVPASVQDQLFAHGLTIYARARRWADIEWRIHQVARERTAAHRPPLTVPEARLLAVLTLEALRTPTAVPERDSIVEALAQTALGELVKAGEVGHVLDLVNLYDTTPIGQDGFIVRYVHGLQMYEKARVRHAESEGSDQSPATSPVIATEYRMAAEVLGSAASAQDAALFATEAVKCGVMRGMALFYAGDVEPAADHLERAFLASATPPAREEALWLAIYALDYGVEHDRPSLQARRDKLASLYIESFPGNDRAAKLLLRLAGSELVDPERAVAVLLEVPRSSELYGTARSHAATILYRMYRNSRGQARDFAATRFAQVAQEAIELEHAELPRVRDDQELRDRASSLILRLRQYVDALLGMQAPDAERAQWGLRIIDEVSALASIEDEALVGELTFRRLQLAIARDDESEAQFLIEQLRAIGGIYSESADRLMYRRALDTFQRRPQDADAAKEVLRHGLRVLDQLRAQGLTMADPSVQSLAARVAEAGAAAWRLAADSDARDTAIAIDQQLINSGIRAIDVLRRLGELAEAASDLEQALDAWRVLLAALADGDPYWYEARYHSLRLLLQVDPSRAREAMDQHKVLHPDFDSAPEPWGERLREIDRQIQAKAPAPVGGPR